MPIASLKDVYSAYDEGKVHTQRFLKGASVAGDLHWMDWGYAAGQPAYNARIGTSLAFNPYVAEGNDAIFFPPIPGGEHRHISDVNIRTLAGGTNQASCAFVMYDLLGVYPLIDGDSTDQQDFTNTLTLPRYTTGEGVLAVLVNHVAPIVAAANGSMTYVNSDGDSKTVAIRVALTGQNKIVSAIPTAGGLGALSIPLTSGCKGVRSVTSLTFTAAPGGLYSLYLYKPLMTLNNNDGNLVAVKVWTEKNTFMMNAWNMPRVLDGAHLGFFFMPNGGGRSVALFGDVTFVWG